MYSKLLVHNYWGEAPLVRSAFVCNCRLRPLNVLHSPNMNNDVLVFSIMETLLLNAKLKLFGFGDIHGVELCDTYMYVKQKLNIIHIHSTHHQLCTSIHYAKQLKPSKTRQVYKYALQVI